MNSNILVTASTLSDEDLLARLEGLAGKERDASAELVAHLAALDSRQMLYAAQGYGSLFTYCTQALRLSEDAACNRIEAARACRRFPLILDLLASGSLSLTSVRLLAPHLTAENHQSVLAKARDRRRREIEALVAELAPRPDLPSTVRKVPCRTVLLARVEKTKLAVAAKPRPRSPIRPAADPPTLIRPSTEPRTPIRPAADGEAPNQDLLSRQVPPAPLSRTVPREVNREVWRRDAGQCAFLSSTGRRCTESTFLEFHHIQPYAKQGPATVANITLRCWRHNQYEAELVFGSHGGSIVGEALQRSRTPAPRPGRFGSPEPST
jgi:hypothetical protein